MIFFPVDRLPTGGALRQRDLDHQQFHRVHSKSSICRYQPHPLCLPLRDRQSIEKILMAIGQAIQCPNMLQGDRQQLKIIFQRFRLSLSLSSDRVTDV
jgi:hypothetical protein